jgi:hypothetical protein
MQALGLFKRQSMLLLFLVLTMRRQHLLSKATL